MNHLRMNPCEAVYIVLHVYGLVCIYVASDVRLGLHLGGGGRWGGGVRPWESVCARGFVHLPVPVSVGPSGAPWLPPTLHPSPSLGNSYRWE